MHGIIVGPPRVTPPSGAQVDGHYVPPKVCPGQSLSWELRIEWLTLHEQTVVTTSSFYCHMQTEVFPEPEKFKPERWLNPTPEMEKYLVPFSKGKRMCPGKEFVPVSLFASFVHISGCDGNKADLIGAFSAGYPLWSCLSSLRPSIEGSRSTSLIPRESQPSSESVALTGIFPPDVKILRGRYISHPTSQAGFSMAC